ncbi:MAG: PqiC family protein, partial [Planctomycetota bacterium]
MRVRSLLLYAALPLVVAACRSEPANFYLLTPVHHPSNGSDTQTAAGPWVGIGPITLPQYLDRPQIVIRAAAGAVTLGEFDQWAESLQDGLSRVIGENLA